MIINNYKAYIFDFDGVVMDTESLHFKAWNKGFEIMGESLTEEEYLPLKSTGRKHIVNIFSQKIGRKISESEALEICRVKDDCFKELCKSIDKSLMIKGVEDFLIRLKKTGTKIAVASSASTTTELLGKVELTKYFDVVADGNLGLPKKPDPAIFFRAAELLGVEAKDCLVFEDSPAGLKAAENAGMDFVAVGAKSEKAILEIKDFTDVQGVFIKGELADIMYGKQIAFVPEIKVVDVIYSTDKLKRFIVTKNHKHLYSYCYEVVELLDEEEYNYVRMCYGGSADILPANWLPRDSGGASFYDNLETVMNEIYSSYEYNKYFKK